jgi:protein-disulfide isomerase
MAKPNNFKPVTVITVIVVCIFLGYGIVQYFNNKNTGETTPVADIIKEDGAVTSTGPLSKEEVQTIIKDYISEHPEEILKSVENMQRKAAEDVQKNAKKEIEARRTEIEDTTHTPFMGNPNGDIKIVEFFDYSCGYCKSANPTILQLINEDTNVTVILKEFPILGPISETAARYALAVYAIDKSKYADFHNKLMKDKIANEAAIIAVAESLGVDTAKLKTEAAKPEIMDTINKNRELAKSIGIQGTPAFIIGGELIPGAMDLAGLKAKIEEIRKKPAAAPAEVPATTGTPEATDKPAPDAAMEKIEPATPAEQAPAAPTAPAAVPEVKPTE